MKQQSEKAKTAETQDTAEKAATPEVLITKVLAVVNENAALTNALSYLRRRDFQVKLVHTLMDGVRELTNFKPDILLLSWSLKGTDIRKVHPVLTKKFTSICFVVGEDDTTKTTSSMLSSGLPNTILYPVTGVNLYTRIQAALGRTNTKNKEPKKRSRSKDKTLLGGVEYKRPKKSDIPPETVWTMRVNSPNPANQIWETILYKGGKPQYFYYKGEKPPEKWLAGKDEGTTERAYTFMSDVQATADLLSSFADYSESSIMEFDQDDPENLEVIETEKDAKKKSADGFVSSIGHVSKDLISKEQTAKSKEITSKANTDKALLREMRNSISSLTSSGTSKEALPRIKATTLSTTQTQTLLEKSVNIAIDMAMKSEIQSFEAPILVDEVSNMTVSIIKSSKFKGYLVSGQASDVANPKFMKKVFENLNEEMRKQNEALSTLCGVLELKLGTVPFKKWTQERAEFSIQSTIGNEEIVFAFVPVDELPQNFIDEDLVPVAIDKFEEDKILYFDIFLHMQVNEKHILYLKNGSVFSKISRDRLKAHNTKVLYVKKTDEHLFFAYSARNVFEKSTINREIPINAVSKKAG